MNFKFLSIEYTAMNMHALGTVGCASFKLNNKYNNTVYSYVKGGDGDRDGDGLGPYLTVLRVTLGRFRGPYGVLDIEPRSATPR